MSSPEVAEPPSWWPRGLVTLFSELAAIGAVLYYFGWASSQATFAYFGLNVRWFELSTTDYVMQSLQSVFDPFLWLCAATVLATYLHGRLATRFRRRTVTVVRAAAGILAAVACFAYIYPRFGYALDIGLPLLMTAAAGAAAYADHLAPLATGSPVARGRAAALVGVCLLGGFWALSLYAEDEGEGIARSFVGAAPHAADVLVYSKERIAVAGTGVSVLDIPAKDSHYRFRYAGLRILLHTKDRFVLVPALWQRGRDTVIVLPDGDDLRIDVLAR
ncbi:hypothetical protein [Actinoplanes subglobosus]|uniref:Uncharacterized protein n=1 Tax=Actinoplanes subglobosus TaxID=1547892 RepID=A0ABV8J347_9ACTN